MYDSEGDGGPRTPRSLVTIDVRQRHEALALSVRPRLGVRRRAGLRTALR